MSSGKTIALTIQTFVVKVMSLLFNMLSRFVIAFLLGSKYLLISWLELPSEVILEPKKIKSITVSIVCHEVRGLAEKSMAPHSSTLAWKIPWTEESGSYSPWGCKRVGHDLATKQQQPSLWSNSHLYMTTGKTMV